MDNIKVGIGLVVAILLCGVGYVGCRASVNNTCVNHETGIVAQDEQDQNNYANYFNTIKEMAQVPDMHVAHLKEVYDSAMKGRYGADGSKAVFQAIVEAQPNVDPKLYERLQRAMQAGRKDFENDQKSLIDKKRAYESYLGSYMEGSIAHGMGFPKIELAKYKIVTNDATDEAFRTHKAGPIQLR